MRRFLEAFALGLLVALAALAAVLVARGRVAVHVQPQQPTAKVVAQAAVSPAVKAQDQLPCPPPPGAGVMGACTPKPVQVYGAKVVPATVDPPASIPDVSSYQRVVEWAAVKRWQLAHHFAPAGIFKMGEFVVDPYAWRNNSQLAALHMWRAGYWFLRNTGCAYEALQIIHEARLLGLRIVFEDDEAPEARGYDGCLTAALQKAGLIVGEYASPGAYPGGTRSGNPAWIAAYGPLNPPAAPWGGPIKAFQCTDGVFGCVTYIPGIGRGDVSVDYGVTKLGAAPPDPYAIFPKPKFSLGDGVSASEYNTVKTWDRSHCRVPARRAVCVSSRAHLVLLRDRELFVAHHALVRGRWVALKRPRWGVDHLGARFQGVSRRLRQR